MHANEHKCQIYADKIHVSNGVASHDNTLAILDVGMDMIGLITPKASNRHRFIFVVIDYFTIWVEVASYANVTRLVVCKFIKKEIIRLYGLPKKIISDNASNFNYKMMVEVCA